MRWQMIDAGGRRWARPVLALGLIGAVLASATAGLAAIRFHVFPEAEPVADAALEDMRGGFTVPKLDITIHFGFEFNTLVELPDIGDAIKPNFVAVPNGTGDGSGRKILTTTRVEFDDPRKAMVTTEEVIRQNGQIVDESTTTERANLKKNPITLQVGERDMATVTRIIDPKQVTTLIENVVSNAHLETNDTIEITLQGVPEL